MGTDELIKEVFVEIASIEERLDKADLAMKELQASLNQLRSKVDKLLDKQDHPGHYMTGS